MFRWLMALWGALRWLGVLPVALVVAACGGP